MNKLFFITGCLLLVTSSFAQTVTQKIQKAFQQFESDTQLRNAISSLYVIEVKTGKVVFDKNSRIGLAPASTQKIITSVTAFELLGKDYRYKTEFAFGGQVDGETLRGNIIVKGSGDPTFGSWRWKNTSEERTIERIIDGFIRTGIKSVSGSIQIYNPHWESQKIPDGWIVQDIGNYYGAGAGSLNWRENQFDIFLKSGNNIGDPVTISGYKPTLYQTTYLSEVKSAKKGSGDNAFIYTNPKIVRGTIPVNENKFMISGSIENPSHQFLFGLIDTMISRGIAINKPENPQATGDPVGMKTVHTEYSPSLDSIIYWFNKKSINLYGEALLKTIAYEKNGFGSTDTGVTIVKDFWKQKGLDQNELNIYDGSGLSPLNRVTTHAQVEILKYAKGKNWYPYFYNALPEFNGMKMKSGTISDVKGFCGYHKAKDGKEYIFSFLVNNYNGLASALVNKMYKVLDVLK
ncbi:MAG: D-alanyl-D-alanine carboxypeptidase/D-alanyl-D-alanine endopeptidase [Chitinophagaceae bacterium]